MTIIKGLNNNNMPKSKKFREIEFHKYFAVEETIITKASRNTGMHSNSISRFFFIILTKKNSMCTFKTILSP